MICVLNNWAVAVVASLLSLLVLLPMAISSSSSAFTLFGTLVSVLLVLNVFRLINQDVEPESTPENETPDEGNKDQE